MNTDKSHGGILPEERAIPLYVIGDSFSHQQACAVKQTEICGVVCDLLGLIDHKKPVTKNMLLEPSLIDRKQRMNRPYCEAVA